MPHEHQYTIVMCAAIGNVAQVADQLLVVGGVRSGIAGVSRRVHTRRSAKSRNANAGVVRQCGHLRQLACMSRLGQCVLDKRHMRFRRVGNAKLGLWHDVDAERRQQSREFAYLARIVRRQHQPGDHRASASVWAASKPRMPPSASRISASSSGRVNGAPSAVPCSSTKPPPAVITTFMSVSHCESSP